ncbi:MAG: lipopolysaccharide transport periplasmic protein LptA [Thiotrichales bacterium]|nr:lipopolysaccharide transport periplasmic protein LptA [Thiotrichales bacterium]
MTLSLHRPSVFTLWLFCSLHLTTWQVHAETPQQVRSAESQNPIKIQADQLLVNEKMGVSRYQGNVVIEQGNMRLTGERIEISHPNNALAKIEIHGSPANFTRKDPVTGSLTRGQAQTILYLAPTDTLTFIGNALVEENGKHKISGAKLLYNLQQQTLQAQSDAQQQERVEVILMPNTGK